MPSLMDIGKSAINAQRQALNVTGQNIANVNTEGYRRRDADLKEVSGSQSEFASKSAQIGLGVSLGEVRRAFNAYLAQSSNSAESKFQSASNFVQSMERLENLILPNEGDLSSQMTSFFGKLSDIAANPGDLAPRAEAIEQASGLANAFNVTSQVVQELRGQLRQSVSEEVEALNRLTESLALVNSRLRASNLGSAPPNALLDERDRLITEISKKALVNVDYGSRYEANLAFGRFAKGPILVSGENAIKLHVMHDDTSGSAFRLGNGIVFKSLDDGSIKGLSDSLSIIESTLEKLDGLTIRVVEELNALHTTGIDYDGEPGKELFTAKQFVVNQPDSNSNELDITLLQVPGKIDIMSDVYCTYNAATDHWSARSAEGVVIGKGRKEIDLGGMVLKINSVPRDGDEFNVSRIKGEAGRVEFLLKDGREFAAASNFVVTPASTNTGSALLTGIRIEPKPPDMENILEITTNSISPVSFTEFRSGGVVGYIPSETQSFDLASFGQSPLVEVNFSPSDGLGKLSLTFGGTQYDFPSNASKNVLTPTDGSFLLSDKIAEYLNNGVIKSSSGHTFKDLGLHAAGSESGLRIAGQSNFTSGTYTTQAGSTSDVLVRDSVDASSFRVFTREGRQIAGQPMSNSEASFLISEENGFKRNAVYRADYLNSIGGLGYRGSQIKNLRPDGYFGLGSVTSMINSGNLSSLIQQNPALNSQAAQTVTVTTSDGLVNESVNLQAGASAKNTVEKLNYALMEAGFVAEATTIASLELDNAASNNGRIIFSFKLEDGQTVPISADYSNKNLQPLVNQINQYYTKTGVSAELSNDGRRVILVDAAGNDIHISNFSGSTLNINTLDQSYKKLISSDTVLDKPTKIVGSIEIKSPREFTFQTSLGGSGLAKNSALLNGGIERTFSSAGTISDFEWQISPDLLASQASPDGSRISTSSAVFNMKAMLNGQVDDLDLSLNSADLSDYRSKDISKVLVEEARKSGTVPAIQGSVISALPPEGAKMSVRVGASTYVLTHRAGSLTVEGPENQRVLATLDKLPRGFQVSIAVPNGTMSGRSIEVLNSTDAAQFGLSSADPLSETVLRGRTFSFENTAGLDVTTGLISGKKYIINSKGNTNFTNADSGNTLVDAKIGTIFTSDGGTLTGSGRVNQVFTANCGKNASGGNSDFLNAIELHSLGDLTTSDIGTEWIVANPVTAVGAVTASVSGGASGFTSSATNNVITVTSAATSAGNVQVSVDGTAYTVALTLPQTTVAEGSTGLTISESGNEITVDSIGTPANGDLVVTIDGKAYTVTLSASSSTNTTTSAQHIADQLDALSGANGCPFNVNVSGPKITITHTKESTASQLVAKLDALTGGSLFPYAMTDNGDGSVKLNDGLTVGSKHKLTNSGSDYFLNGQVLHSNIKLIEAGQKFEVVENASSSHPIGTYFTLNMNASGNIVDEKGVELGNTLGVTKATVKTFDVKVGESDATVEVANHRGLRYVLETNDDKLNFASNRGNSGLVSSYMNVSAAEGSTGLTISEENNILTVDSIGTPANASLVVTVDGQDYSVALVASSSTNTTTAAAHIAAQLNSLTGANNFPFNASASGASITITPTTGVAATSTELNNIGFASKIAPSSSSGAGGIQAKALDNVIKVNAPATSSGNLDVVVDGITYTVSLTAAASPTIAETGSQIKTLLSANSDFNLRYVASESGDGVITLTPRNEKSLLTVTSAASSAGNAQISVDGVAYTVALTLPQAIVAEGSTGLTISESGNEITVDSIGTPADENLVVSIDGKAYTIPLTASSSTNTTTSAAHIAAQLNALSGADNCPFTVTASGPKITITHTKDTTANQLVEKLSSNNDFNQNYLVSDGGQGILKITPRDKTLSVSKLIIDPTINAPLVALTSAQSNGNIEVKPSSEAKNLGLQAGTFDFEVTENGFRATSTTSNPVNIDLDVSGLPGQILSMNELPPEDLIVVLDKEGARRLGAQYELMDAVEEHGTERNYRLEMTDQTTGKIEVIDKANGHSIATRYTSGITELDIDGFRLRLSGFADQNDFFEIGLNQSKSGDARNAEALVELNRSSSERNSFQEDFRSIALAVGSQLVSGRLVEVSATSMRDAARATEDELSGVNLDQEASQLMEQQQAYKAAAQILQAARQMFDTLVGIM